MVSQVSDSEKLHNDRVDHMRSDDAGSDDATGVQVLTGVQALEQEIRKMHGVLRQLQGQPHARHHMVEALKTQAAALQSEIPNTKEHNAQFVLAERMRHLSNLMGDLLAV